MTGQCLGSRLSAVNGVLDGPFWRENATFGRSSVGSLVGLAGAPEPQKPLITAVEVGVVLLNLPLGVEVVCTPRSQTRGVMFLTFLRASFNLCQGFYTTERETLLSALNIALLGLLFKRIRG